MLNERIRKLRLAKGLTLQQVGDVFGISPASVSSWEKGINFPDGRKLQKLAETLGVSVSDLVNSGSDRFNNNVLNVPYVDWMSLKHWPSVLPQQDKTATLLHNPHSSKIFATRYPGTESLNVVSQLPIPGSIVFIDPSRELIMGNVAVILASGSPQLAKCLRSEKGSKLLQSYDLVHEYKKNSDYELIGIAIEWQMSGLFN